MMLVLSLAWGFEVDDRTWSWDDQAMGHTFELNLSTFPSSLGTPAEIEAAFVDGAAYWNDVADVEVRVSGDTSVGAGPDGALTTIWDPGPAPDNVLATAFGWGVEDALTDCDVRFWGENGNGAITWTRELSGGVDFVDVTTHEVGHCLGLGHSDVNAAIMFPIIQFGRGLDPDDEAGLRAIYGDCPDQDGDGYSVCDGDCDDTSVAIHPGASEICDGFDNDCNGAVDSQAATEFDFGQPDTPRVLRHHAFGNHYDVFEPTALHRVSQWVELAEDTTLSFQVFVTRGVTTLRTVVTERVSATTGWVESPPLDVGLEAGDQVFVAVGGNFVPVTSFEQVANGVQQGSVRPIATGILHWTGPNHTSPSWSFGRVAHQRLLLANPADADGDGLTALCGDCDDTNGTTIPNAMEVCDGIDNDCDGEIDEGEDADGDGLATCVDPCPDESGDPDGDGICAAVDVCPQHLDPGQEDADGDGAGDACDPTPNGDPPPSTGGGGGGGCAFISGLLAMGLVPRLRLFRA